MSILYIVATPIGNLEDITKRALRVLAEVDLILCEDTRQTQKLLNFYNIKTKTLSYHQHSKLQKIGQIIQLLKLGKNLALVSDAGTPGISDPGNQLVAQVASAQITQVQPVPGSSALTAAASVSGFPMDKFLFLGFPPMKKKRKKFFEEILGSKYPVIFYESPHRIIKTLKELSSFVEGLSSLDIMVGRELTKKFETIYRGKIGEITKTLEKEGPRGEFAVVVNRNIANLPLLC
ncbi:MAG: 16S rRNA (cytidine(1402)-2'-O)-methyltransferase [bacterium]